MAIELKNGINLLKLTALTPANFGCQWGKVAVDSPTQVDAQFELPYIPDSALKGILNAELELKNDKSTIEKFFGQTDKFDDTKTDFGSPAQISIGNAYLALFPIQFEDGKRAFIIPIHNLYFFQRFSDFGLNDKQMQEILKSLLFEDSKRLTAFSLKEDFLTTSAMTFSFMNKITAEELLAKIRKLIAIITKASFIDEVFLLTGPKTAAYLWKEASEKRTQIKLNEKGVTEKGSLRKIELIPEESTFISLVTNFEKSSFNLMQDIISVGAWEKSGVGWFSIEAIEPTNGELEINNGTISINAKQNLIHVQKIIRDTHKAITTFPADEQKKKKIKSIIFNFGYYQSKFGTEAAVAYELAKAKPNKETESIEIFCHRWLLWQLLDIKYAPQDVKCSYPELEEEALTLFENSGFDDLKKLVIETTWLWLRRFSEIELNY